MTYAKAIGYGAGYTAHRAAGDEGRGRLAGLLLLTVLIAVMLVILSLFSPAPAAAGELLDISGLAELVAEKAKESKVATTANARLEYSGALYVPFVIMHSKTPREDAVLGPLEDYAEYLELGVGAELMEGGRGRPFLNAGANLPALFGRLWRSAWWRSHVKMTKLPPLWVGPYIRVPTKPGKWVIGNEVGAFVSIRLSGLSPK